MKEGTPITSSEARNSAIMAVLHMIVYYGIAFGIWGLAFNKSFLWFVLSGVIVSLVISMLFIYPVMSGQRTQERIRELMSATGMLWGNLAIVIGILGIVVWIIRAIFF